MPAGNSLLLPNCRISSRSPGHSAVRVSALARQRAVGGVSGFGNERRGDGGVDHKEQKQGLDVPETTDLSKDSDREWRCKG